MFLWDWIMWYGIVICVLLVIIVFWLVENNLMEKKNISIFLIKFRDDVMYEDVFYFFCGFMFYFG